MKRRRDIILVSCLAMLVFVVGVSATERISVTTRHNLSTGDLGTAIRQEGKEAWMDHTDESDTAIQFHYEGNPGDRIPHRVWVENTKAEDCYVRVVVEKNWQLPKKDGVVSVSNSQISPKDLQLSVGSDWYQVDLTLS